MTDHPRAELPHWSTYTSVGDWYKDYRGRVPIQMPFALTKLMERDGLTFREAYRKLVDAGAIIHIDPEDDHEPGEAR